MQKLSVAISHNIELEIMIQLVKQRTFVAHTLSKTQPNRIKISPWSGHPIIATPSKKNYYSYRASRTTGKMHLHHGHPTYMSILLHSPSSPLDQPRKKVMSQQPRSEADVLLVGWPWNLLSAGKIHLFGGYISRYRYQNMSFVRWTYKWCTGHQIQDLAYFVG